MAQQEPEALISEYRQAVDAMERRQMLVLLVRGSNSTRGAVKELPKLRDKVFDLRIKLWDLTRMKPPRSTKELDLPPWNGEPSVDQPDPPSESEDRVSGLRGG